MSGERLPQASHAPIASRRPIPIRFALALGLLQELRTWKAQAESRSGSYLC